MSDPENAGAYEAEGWEAPAVGAAPGAQPQRTGRYRIDRILSSTAINAFLGLLRIVTGLIP